MKNVLNEGPQLPTSSKPWRRKQAEALLDRLWDTLWDTMWEVLWDRLWEVLLVLWDRLSERP